MSFPRLKRMRGGVGAIDPDSDIEPDIDVSATADTSTDRIKLDHRQFESKRRKSTHLQSAPELPALPVQVDTQEKIDDPVEEVKKKQGASVMMAMFSPHFENLQRSILSRACHRDIGQICQCGSTEALYRCAGIEKCFDPRLRCQACILKDHILHPLHRIEIWNGNHFMGTSLQHLGFLLHLGHHGDRCPNLSSTTTRPRIIVVGHTNGFHKISVHFCHCEGAASEAIQVMDQEFFPATMTQPESMFSFGLLENYHAHSLTSKKSMYDYHAALVNLTNAAFPQDVPNRYGELLRVIRVWSHLAMVRRSGQAHGIDTIITTRRPLSLAIRCPACPEVGVNVDRETMEMASEEEAHKYTLFISADGNFRLQRKNKKDDPDDVALNAGNSYFVDVGPYRKYLRHVDPSEDNNVCQHIRANRLQNIIKFKNAVISGVVAVQCARHGIFLPQGIIDLVRGEGFANTDYAVVHSLADAYLLRWIMLSYDIWCSYSVKLKKRFAKYFPKAACLLDRMRGAIPKMHVKNHIESCQLLWAFNYIRYSGATYGEKIEGSWDAGNQAAGSTKEMNDGHRHDTLDDFNNYWNWCKLRKLSSDLYKWFTNCLDTLKTREKNFDAFDSTIKAEIRERWNDMDDTPHMKDKEVISVHVTKFRNKKGPPTQKQAYQALLQKEIEDVLAGTGTGGCTQFINDGLQLERDQDKIRVLSKLEKPTEAQRTSLYTARLKLHNNLNNWRSVQFNMFPALRKSVTSVDPTIPENTPLLLPSSFNQPYRTQLGLDKVAEIEYQIREGKAHEALDAVRMAIKTFNVNVDFKAKYVHGQGPNTRAQDFLRTLAADKVSGAEKFRRNRQALLQLGLSPDDLVLQELHNNQLWAKDMSRPAQLGDSNKEEPWFWRVGKPSDLSDAEDKEWSVEMDRVRWFRDRSARDRAREEKEILEEEMNRAVKFFRYMQGVWGRLANATTQGPGHSAYSNKQSSMYAHLAKEAEDFSKKAADILTNMRQVEFTSSISCKDEVGYY